MTVGFHDGQDDGDDFHDGNANMTAKGSDGEGGVKRWKDSRVYHVNLPRADNYVIGFFYCDLQYIYVAKHQGFRIKNIMNETPASF